MQKIPETILRTLAQMAAEDRLRRVPAPLPGLADFCSNDFLGLARMRLAVPDAPAGAGGARLLAGTHAAHQALEAAAATQFRAEAALLFNSGYDANVGLLSCLAQRGDTYLYDEACHASIKDGMRLSMANRFSFRHNDLADLGRLLGKAQGNTYIVVESLYSMDGDWADLSAIMALARAAGAWVIVDEAHSTGICGPDGAGHTVALGLQDELLARIHTLGKAVGRMGALVVGPQPLVDYLVNRARSWIYSTAMPPALAADITEALAAVATMDVERQRLAALRTALDAALAAQGLPQAAGTGPIYPVRVPGATRAKAVAAHVRAQGLDVRAVLAPTVPAGAERLRVVLHSYNSEAEVQALARAIAEALAAHPGN